MRPQNFGYTGHVQPSEAWGDYEVHHGHHAVQLCLVQGDVGVECVLTLFLSNRLVNTSDNLPSNFLVQIPRDILNKPDVIQTSGLYF